MTTLNVYEILSKFDAVETRPERIRILQENNQHYFKEVLKYTFNPKYEFYTESKFPVDYQKPDTFPGLRLAGIESEHRKAYLFQKGNETAESLTEEKRHVLLLQLLESFEPQEAEIWFNMLKKNLKIKGLTASLVNEVYPELLV